MATVSSVSTFVNLIRRKSRVAGKQDTGVQCFSADLSNIVDNKNNHSNDNVFDVTGIDEITIKDSASRKQNEDLVNTIFVDSLMLNRGPDVTSKHTFSLAYDLVGHMQGCVLHLRGHMTPQPVKDAKGNALLWNGEIFDGIKVADYENDTEVLFNSLVDSLTEEGILKTMQKIHGPRAFIFWQANSRKLWFGRDMFGRRSLLWHLPVSNGDHLVLSSVALGEMNYTEVPSVGIFCLDFSKISEISCDDFKCPSLILYPWKSCMWPGTSLKVVETSDSELLPHLYPTATTCLSVHVDKQEILNIWIPEKNTHIPETAASFSYRDSDSANCITLEDMLFHILKNKPDLDALAEELIQVLQASVDKRVHNLPRGQVSKDSSHLHKSQSTCVSYETQDHQELYSSQQEHEINQHRRCGDKDQANVAVLFSGGLDSTILAALADRCVPEGEPIDLLNVAFEQPVRKSLSKIKSKPYKKKKQNNPQNPNKLSHLTCLDKHCDSFGCSDCQCDATHKSKDKHLLNNCVRTNDSSSNIEHSHTTDHSLIYSNPNVNITNSSEAVENSQQNSSCSSSFDVPDRQTGRIALSELNPKRKWNFVEIDISQAELRDQRDSHIRKLIYPLQTVLDDSIGCAVWFAARGSGVLAHDRNRTFVSRAKVILCGMAADEQFAGYSRHRVTYKMKGWEGLLKELQEEIWRISARNLGRDDRIITDHGKESRFPYLDETFTQFVSSIPVFKLVDLSLPRGVGDKLLLRLCALKLGLVKTACQPKRAIQFGSKIAKLDNRKEKGSDVCGRLT